MFARRTFENGEDIRKIYLLHALNHILKTRSRVLKNNARLAQASKEGKEMEYVCVYLIFVVTASSVCWFGTQGTS